jgi:homoaconitase
MESSSGVLDQESSIRLSSRVSSVVCFPPGAKDDFAVTDVLCELDYSAPGLLMLGCDSHTPNAGGLGAIAIGVGGADAVDAMTATPWELKAPKLIGIELKGELSGWCSAKDVVLEVVGRLSVRGGTGSILEYYGEGVERMGATGLATIANMGAEMGATTTTFPYTKNMQAYLQATNRSPVADAADAASAQGFLSADKGAEYDTHITIDLSTLEPKLNGPFTPDLSTPLSKFASLVQEKGWKDELSAALIGSCTNSSYEDMSRVASIARQARSKGLSVKSSFMVTPGYVACLSKSTHVLLTSDPLRAVLS